MRKAPYFFRLMIVLSTLLVYGFVCPPKIHSPKGSLEDGQDVLIAEHFGENDMISKSFFGADVMYFDRHIERAYHGKDLYFLLDRHLHLLLDLGIGLVGLNLSWGEIEPIPPRGGVPSYNWAKLDKIMAFFHNIDIAVKIQVFPSTMWASEIPTKALNRAGPIKKVYMNAWKEFVQNLVERYDGDGLNDAFNMNFSALKILNISGEVEANNNWSKLGGSPETYDRLLTQTTGWIREVSPSVLVARAGVNFGPAFDGIEGAEALSIKVEREKRKDTPQLSFFLNSIREEDRYDLFPIQLNYDWAGIIPEVNWIRKKLRELGYSKPMFGNHIRTTVPNFRLESIFLDPKNHEYTRAKAIYLREQASQTIKKLTAGLACGLHHMFIATIFDGAFSGSPGIQRFKNKRELSWAFTGLFDAEMIVAGKKMSQVPKPVYHSYKLYISKIQGCSRKVKTLHLDPNIKVFLFNKKGRSIYLVWYEGKKARSGRCDSLSKNISLPVFSDRVLITHIITEIDQKGPRMETIAAKGGKIELLVSDVPIFIEEL